MTTLPELPLVTGAQVAAIRAAPRTAQAHRALLADLPAMNALQQGGAARLAQLPAQATYAAWNLERCLFPQASADLLAGLGADVVLLSEVDHGMARTGQRHTTAEIADALGMAYLYGVEFFELSLGSDTEAEFCTDDHNARGWHGNAILSAAPFEDARLIRLDADGHWFTPAAGAPDQPRVGGRMAIAALVPTETGPICVVSTHLESNADAAHRCAQMDHLLREIDDFAPGLPVLIGGDLNTGNALPPNFDWRDETLFELAELAGYDWGFTPVGMTTRASLITRHPTRQMKLDWIAGRDMACTGKGCAPALGPDGTPLSDHDCVWCRARRA